MNFFSFFRQELAIDLGTANTLIIQNGEVVVDQPSIVAINRKTGLTIAAGTKAMNMHEKTHDDIKTIRPLKDGVIADFQAAESMIEGMINMIGQRKRFFSHLKMVICIPSGITEVEKRAVFDSADHVDSKETYLIHEPMAAALGIGLDVEEPTGNMIIDIGGGTTEVAVLSLQGTVISESVRIAGDELTEAITQYMKKIHNLVIGERTAEDIKIKIGSAYPTADDNDSVMEVRGLHLLSGLPRTVSIKGPEIRESMVEPLAVIIEAVRRTLERTPPELAADIIDRGIMLAGGGALLKGLDTLISHETGLVTHIAADPLSCVVLGTGRVLENFKQLERVFSGRSRNM